MTDEDSQYLQDHGRPSKGPSPTCAHSSPSPVFLARPPPPPSNNSSGQILPLQQHARPPHLESHYQILRELERVSSRRPGPVGFRLLSGNFGTDVLHDERRTSSDSPTCRCGLNVLLVSSGPQAGSIEVFCAARGGPEGHTLSSIYRHLSARLFRQTKPSWPDQYKPTWETLDLRISRGRFRRRLPIRSSDGAREGAEEGGSPRSSARRLQRGGSRF
jgi:hypothetical protein